LSSHIHCRKANARALSGLAGITAVRPIVIASRDSVLDLRLSPDAVDFAQLTGSGLSQLPLPPIDLGKTKSRIASITSGSGDLIDGQGHHVRRDQVYIAAAAHDVDVVIHNIGDVRDIRDVVHRHVLLTEDIDLLPPGMRRAAIRIVYIELMPLVQPAAVVNALAAVIGLVVSHNRVPVPAIPPTRPCRDGHIAEPLVTAVVVPEVIVAIIRANPKIDDERCWIERETRRPNEVGLRVHGAFEVHRREAGTAITHLIVPKATAEDGPARSPRPTVGHPEPVGLRARPITGAPAITGLVVVPATGGPEIVFPGSGRRRTLLQCRRRRIVIGHLLYFFRSPKPRDPLPASVDRGPVTRNPAMAGRNPAPNTAHPDEVFALFFPGPVAGNPHDVVPFRPILRWDLLNVGRWLYRHYQARFDLARYGAGERFVNRSTCENLNAFGNIDVCREQAIVLGKCHPGQQNPR
jgi:hypothetical protein